MVLKLQEEDTVITDNVAVQKLFHHYYSNLYKRQEIFLEKIN